VDCLILLVVPTYPLDLVIFYDTLRAMFLRAKPRFKDGQKASWVKTIDVVENHSGRVRQMALFPSHRSLPELNCEAAIKTLIERRGVIVVTSSHAGYAPLLGRTA
jgi:hypothetical protein